MLIGVVLRDTLKLYMKGSSMLVTSVTSNIQSRVV